MKHICKIHVEIQEQDEVVGPHGQLVPIVKAQTTHTCGGESRAGLAPAVLEALDAQRAFFEKLVGDATDELSN